MNILMIMLSGAFLVNNQPNKEQFETITKTRVVEQYNIIPSEVIQEQLSKKIVAKKTKTKKKTKKKTVKKAKKKKVIKNKRVRYNVGEIQSYAHQLVIEYGWSEEDYQALVLLWYRESGWNPNAYNKSSGACGIPQSKPCSKMAKFGRDYRTNWKVQVRWGLDYIKDRYGTPSEAYRKFLGRKPHWY